MIHALSTFVPGISRQQHQIIDWFTDGKLTDETLTSIKLVGTMKCHVDPSIYRLDISCLEMDSKTGSSNLVTSPLYLDGQWIYNLLSKVPLYSVSFYLTFAFFF